MDIAHAHKSLKESMMKKLLLIIGVVTIVAGVIALLFSALQLYGYYHLLDGEADMYVAMRWRMIISLVIGIVLMAMGAVCLIARTKM